MHPELPPQQDVRVLTWGEVCTSCMNTTLQTRELELQVAKSMYDTPGILDQTQSNHDNIILKGVRYNGMKL